MKISTHSGFNPDADVWEGDNQDIVPFVYDIEPDDVFGDVKQPRTPETAHDELDSMADKLGSYALARERLNIPEPVQDVSAAALEARLDAKFGPPRAPKGKSTGKYVSGPQLGEETAPHIDQRLPQEEAVRRRANMEHKINPVLRKAAINIVRKHAQADGINPDLAERAYRLHHPD